AGVRTSIVLPGSGRPPFSERTTARISPVPGLTNCTAEYTAPPMDAIPAATLTAEWGDANDPFPTTTPVDRDTGVRRVSQTSKTATADGTGIVVAWRNTLAAICASDMRPSIRRPITLAPAFEETSLVHRL